MGIFGRSKPGSDAKGDDPTAALREACERNTPVCVVKPTQTGRVPMARGRLLRLNEDTIDIEEVSVPGLDLEFGVGDDLDAFFSVHKSLYHFRTTLLSAREPKRLNTRIVILGMSISRPVRLEQGDRRGLFRVSLGALEDRATVEVWRLRLRNRDAIEAVAGAEQDGAGALEIGMPSMAFNLEELDLSKADADGHREADYSGWLCDGTESGLGLRLEYVPPQRFSIFEPVLVRVKLPGSAEPVRLLCEVRSKRTVGDDGTRLGVVVIPEQDGRALAEKTAVLRAFLTDVQRQQLRRTRKRSA